MYRFLFLIYFCLNVSFLKAQGFNGEVNFNNSYNQYAFDLINIHEYSYLAKWEGAVGGFTNPVSIAKIDTLENVIWNVTYNPLNTESNFIDELLPGGDSSFFVRGLAQPTCDLVNQCILVVNKYNLNGNIQWTKTFPSYSCFYNSLSFMYLKDDGNLVLNFTDSISSLIYKIDPLGNFADSISLSVRKIQRVAESNNNIIAASKTDSIFLFDASGTIINQKVFSSNIESLLFKNDTLVILTNDSIFTFDESLQEINKNGFPSYTDFSNLKSIQNRFRFISHETTQQNIFVLNLDLTLNSNINIPATLTVDSKKDYSESHFSNTIQHDLTEFSSIRHQDFSLLSLNNTTPNHPDVGVIDIQATQVWVNPSQWQGVYDHKVYADVLIKNYGFNVVTSCRLNHDITFSSCSRIVYSEEFVGLNILPGDSLWLTCGLIHSELDVLSGSDTLYEEICIYTSHPNQKADLNVSNDEYCENVLIGIVGIKDYEKENIEIFPNPAQNYLIIKSINSNQKNVEIFSISGQKVLQTNMNQQLNLDISTLPIGYYFITIHPFNYPLIIIR